ncbi:MAG: hypothetical protein DLM57_07585 [Pseudonocardiales bacterium]|nr:MAG: hypothetical protein DLM57_07585 [Pseudonocardiales bacterium]
MTTVLAPETRNIPGPTLFVRYAFPPNYHGACGPPDSQALFQYGATTTVDDGLRDLARQFAGAWPYLELIANATGVADPLDRRVVEAYWVGNSLLDRVGVRPLGESMEDRFRSKTGLQFGRVADSVLAGGMPHHSYHVFCIYPWVGLLGDDRRYEQALMVLDRCRIRWGQVRQVRADQLMVESQPLLFEQGRLLLGPPTVETVERTLDGVGLVPEFHVGDWVSMHWEWVCDRLGARQLAALRHYTRVHLDVVNDRLDHSGAIIALG